MLFLEFMKAMIPSRKNNKKYISNQAAKIILYDHGDTENNVNTVTPIK